jgi:hypothetical protein
MHQSLPRYTHHLSQHSNRITGTSISNTITLISCVVRASRAHGSIEVTKNTLRATPAELGVAAQQ